MGSNRLIVTGEKLYIERRNLLFKELEQKFTSIVYLPRTQEWYEYKAIKIIIKLIYLLITFDLQKADTIFRKNRGSFVSKSRHLEKEILNLRPNADLVFHIFGQYTPFLNKSNIPYVLYLDYTMALAEKHWISWAYFLSRKERNSFWECERLNYQRANHIFVMSSIVKNSLILDYGIKSDKITVVGAASNFEFYQGEKKFGTQRILFNGSDFDRKGGDIVLRAFEKVKQVLPNAKLYIIGKKINSHIDGVESLGFVSSPSHLQDIFLATDLIVAPARCEPFGIFLLDAMNYGVPCLVTPNQGNGITEFLESGVDSIITESSEPEILAHHITNLLSNPHLLALMSEAARSKIKTQLNWNNIAYKISTVLFKENLI